jgi:hypothetical protein
MEVHLAETWVPAVEVSQCSQFGGSLMGNGGGEDLSVERLRRQRGGQETPQGEQPLPKTVEKS